jgi:hypothetical protein
MEKEECSICYEQFTDIDFSETNCCKHKFHTNCLLKCRNKCPLCRADISSITSNSRIPPNTYNTHQNSRIPPNTYNTHQNSRIPPNIYNRQLNENIYNYYNFEIISIKYRH